ncbi:putative protein-lysine deacylase ABHD14B [Apostichopus japonicus]
MTGSVKVNSQAICAVMFIVIVLGGLYLYYPYKEDDITSARQRVEDEDDKTSKQVMLEDNFKTGKWEEMKTKMFDDKSLTIKEERVKVDGNEVFYRECQSSEISQPRGVLLFLHGQAFSSKTWKELGTLHFMASAGYRPIAVDLPGFGETKQFTNDAATLVLKLKESFELGDTPVIIISPSMSGKFSIPLLITHPEAFKGYVPVAPVGTNLYKESNYQKVEVPTCIIYGEKDTGLGQESLSKLSNIPGKEVHELKGAGHPAYLDAPAEFHNILLNFSKKVYA